MYNMYHSEPSENNQKHVHEITGITRIQEERRCDEGECHNHRFATVSGEAIQIPGKRDHFHEITFRTDTADGHYHEFCGKSSGAIDVGNGKHVHFVNDFTTKEDGHKHEFQVATLIDSPTEFKKDCY